MSKVIVNMSLTLDGIMQVPGRSDEDTRGDFQYGGWALPYIIATYQPAEPITGPISQG